MLADLQWHSISASIPRHQQIVNLLVVYLEIAYFDASSQTPPGNVLKQLPAEPGDDSGVDPAVNAGLVRAHHAVALAAACLPISKQAGVVAAEGVLQQRATESVKHVFLGSVVGVLVATGPTENSTLLMSLK